MDNSLNSMPEIMTLEEVAEYLRVSERTVYDWAQKGDIPCGKFGTSWRFRRREIEQWIEKRLKGERNKGGDFVPLFLYSVLRREHVILTERATKAEILNMLIDLLATSPDVKSKSELKEGIYHREQLMSTGIGMGIGIPHVRLRSVKNIVMAAALVREGVVDYESLDSVPVKLVFMIAARDDQHTQHIKLLSQLSSRLKEEELRNLLVCCQDSDAFYNLLVNQTAPV
jgi:PTS system nitrogen regulatory IIA component